MGASPTATTNMLNSDDFVFEDCLIVSYDKFGNESYSNGVKLVHKETKKGLGEYFQAQCRSIEWESALIVHEKYKRKYDLQHEHLVQLREFAESFSAQRKASGKNINKDFLTQVCSAELKRILDQGN